MRGRPVVASLCQSTTSTDVAKRPLGQDRPYLPALCSSYSYRWFFFHCCRFASGIFNVIFKHFIDM